MPFLFEHNDYVNNHGMDVPRLKEILTRWQVGLHEKAWMGLQFNNHDMPRVVSLFGDDTRYRAESAKLFGALLLTLEGTPFIYQGEEIGMTNMPFPTLADYRDLAAIHVYRDLTEQQGLSTAAALSHLHAKSRDNARTPMQWDGSTNAGFTSGDPWIMVNPNYTTINVAKSVGDPNSIFAFYQELIALRKRSAALVYGRFALRLPDHPHLFVYTRTLEDEQFLIALNVSDQPEQWEVPEPAELILCNYATGSPTLRPYEARIYRHSCLT